MATTKTTAPDENPTQPRKYLRARVVMPMLGYRDRGSFWQAVWREGIPCVRISPRMIVFPEAALLEFLTRRSNVKPTA